MCIARGVLLLSAKETTYHPILAKLVGSHASLPQPLAPSPIAAPQSREGARTWCIILCTHEASFHSFASLLRSRSSSCYCTSCTSCCSCCTSSCGLCGGSHGSSDQCTLLYEKGQRVHNVPAHAKNHAHCSGANASPSKVYVVEAQVWQWGRRGRSSGATGYR